MNFSASMAVFQFTGAPCTTHVRSTEWPKMLRGVCFNAMSSADQNDVVGHSERREIASRPAKSRGATHPGFQLG
ncbi:hypothetical protein BRAS3843_2800001 [Bradyrhizobium sp. STM 3843]|nr:hypothetical protein BRAS3843_2800001 [Bradyrhizobium sp. STM 3843]